MARSAKPMSIGSSPIPSSKNIKWIGIQVRLKGIDCKSIGLNSFAGSNPALSTNINLMESWLSGLRQHFAKVPTLCGSESSNLSLSARY